MLKEGTKAPVFNVPDQTGTNRSLSDYKGKWILIYFYPKDLTPGCTTEACSIRDVYGDFKKAGIEVLGVSKDSVKRHQKFIEEKSLPFTLLADESTEMIQAYEAWAEKSMFGKKYMGILRISYLIDPKGVIRKVYSKVKPATHADEVLKDQKELAG